jgi:putative hydrolase of the HAD superfamily
MMAKKIKPEMILFDYGHTLLCEPGWDALRGQKALFEYVTVNKNSLTPEQVNDFSKELYKKGSNAREIGLEIHIWHLLRFLYEYLEIEFSVSLEEAEKILWNNTFRSDRMPNAEKMLDYVNASGIRSGVISNIGWSGAALTEHINRMLPRNKFEFIIASSEYMFRKPNPMLFELALRKAGLDAVDVWYCGDKVKYDVEGSAAVGIFPVWYQNETIENPWPEKEKLIPRCEHLHIRDWLELIEVLKGLK